MATYTISTHNGSSVSRQHNLRNPKIVMKEPHINPNGLHKVVFDIDPREAYKKIFGKALEEYNKKARPDRQIKDYYEHVKKSAKQHPVYEMIIQVGSADNKPDLKTVQSIYAEYTRGWQKRNPNLRLTGVYLHADEEGAPHVHIDYIPVANGYKRGLSKQAGLVKALEEQGFYKQGRETSQIQWERSENKALEDICNKRELVIMHPKKEGIKHINTKQYKLEKKLESTQKELENKCKELENAKKNVNDYKNKINILEKECSLKALNLTSLKKDYNDYEHLLEEHNALKKFVDRYSINDISLLDIFNNQRKKQLLKELPECEIEL